MVSRRGAILPLPLEARQPATWGRSPAINLWLLHEARLMGCSVGLGQTR